MKRVLITGASGFLGYNLCRLWRSDFDLIGVYHTHPVAMSGVLSAPCDLSDAEALELLVDRVRPDAVVHAAALSDPNWCQQNRVPARRINVDAAVAVAQLCAERAIRCIFTSSDLVFDGQNAPYREEDPVGPMSVYGEQKALAEEGMRRCNPDVVICRMPLMFGDAAPAAGSFVQPMIEALRVGRELRLFTDEFRTPLGGRAAAEGLRIALERGSGVLHLGGPERISRFEFGRLLAKTLGSKDARLVACRREDVSMPAPRPADVSLRSLKAAALGFCPAPLKEQIRLLEAC